MATLKFTVHVTGIFSLKARMARASEQAQHAITIQIAKDTSPFVPMLTGSLDERTRIESDTIVYPGPYARYLYYGKLMVDPATGSPFASKGATKVLRDKNLVFNHANHEQAQSHWFEASKAQNMGKWMNVIKRAIQHEF